MKIPIVIEAEPAVALDRCRPREDEHRFDVEDHEQQGEDVVPDLALRPSVADRIDAGFVRRELVLAGPMRPHAAATPSKQASKKHRGEPEPDDR